VFRALTGGRHHSRRVLGVLGRVGCSKVVDQGEESTPTGASNTGLFVLSTVHL